MIYLLYQTLPPRVRAPGAWDTGVSPMSADNDTTHVVLLPLNEKHQAIIDAIDADLAQYKWSVGSDKDTYPYRFMRKSEDPNYSIYKRTYVWLHKVIMGRALNRVIQKSEQVDHKDGNPLNNRRSNLRLATQSQNNANRRPKLSGLKGTFFSAKVKKWGAQIQYEGKHHWLGYFNTEIEAHEAYCKAAVQLHGEFARFE